MPQVRVIGEDGSQLGILPVREALALAQEKSLDLVEVSPTARPPVCRIMDYGKFKYEQSKRERTARKKQHVQQLKEVKLRPKIDDHDFDFKIQHAREFLAARDKVKVTLTFRGREMAHPELGHQMMQRVIASLRGRFHRIVMDTPPVALADTLVLARLADGVLVVVRAGVTPRPAVERALAGIDRDRLLGLVLNEVDDTADEYAYAARSSGE